MKHLKRILCLLLAAVLTLTLCGCGADSADRDKNDDDRDVNPPTLIGGKDTVTKETTATQTTTATTQHEVALKRGNEVGDVCYDADLPIITAAGIQTETVDPTAFGKVTVINFWGTWCVPSREEMVYFDAIAKKYSKDIRVVAVHGMLPDTAPTYIAQNYPDSPIVFLSDSGENANEYYTQMGGNGSYPRTVVLNEKGIITHIFAEKVTESELETAVLEAMGRM